MSTSPDVDTQNDVFRKSIGIEKQQEELLKTKYPNLKAKGGSSLLKKRMAQKQTKYFDSGDYNMARAQMATANKQKQIVPEVKEVTGDHMPTPDEMPRIRKQSQSTLVTGQVYSS